MPLCLFGSGVVIIDGSYRPRGASVHVHLQNFECKPSLRKLFDDWHHLLTKKRGRLGNFLHVLFCRLMDVLGVQSFARTVGHINKVSLALAWLCSKKQRVNLLLVHAALCGPSLMTLPKHTTTSTLMRILSLYLLCA